MHLLTDTEKSKRWQALAATGVLPASSKKRKTRLRQIKATLARQRKRTEDKRARQERRDLIAEVVRAILEASLCDRLHVSAEAMSRCLYTRPFAVKSRTGKARPLGKMTKGARRKARDAAAV